MASRKLCEEALNGEIKPSLRYGHISPFGPRLLMYANVSYVVEMRVTYEMHFWPMAERSDARSVRYRK
jgi:hypothetical protein